MAKRRMIEVVARAPEDGLELARTAGGEFVLAITMPQGDLPNVSDGKARRTFNGLREARAFARRVMQLVETHSPRRKVEDDAEATLPEK